MNDEDIKKELEQHIRIANYVDLIFCNCVSVDLLQKTIDCINRQQAEIERLNGNLFTISNACMQRRNEAIKEFAERLRKEAVTKCDWDNCVDVEDIDKLAAELVGEENA